MTKKLSALAVIAMAALVLPGFIAQRRATPEPTFDQAAAVVRVKTCHRGVGSVLRRLSVRRLNLGDPRPDLVRGPSGDRR